MNILLTGVNNEYIIEHMLHNKCFKGSNCYATKKEIYKRRNTSGGL